MEHPCKNLFTYYYWNPYISPSCGIYYAVWATTWPPGHPFAIFPLILRHVSYPKGVVLGLQKQLQEPTKASPTINPIVLCGGVWVIIPHGHESLSLAKLQWIPPASDIQSSESWSNLRAFEGLDRKQTHNSMNWDAQLHAIKPNMIGGRRVENFLHFQHQTRNATRACIIPCTLLDSHPLHNLHLHISTFESTDFLPWLHNKEESLTSSLLQDTALSLWESLWFN